MFNSAPATSKQSRYSGGEYNPYKAMEQGHALKGLIKPFKGKGDYELLAASAKELCEDINKLMLSLTERFSRAPYSLLNLRLAVQRYSGKSYLRWRTKKLDKMGQRYWVDVINNPQTPVELLPDLLAFEQERIALNMQYVELSHIIREAERGIQQIEEAESLIESAKLINRKKGRR